LRKLEEQFPVELAVIGVHSGKYHAERVTRRIRDASLRLGAEHPIVNDRHFRIWRSYAVSAWPTLVVVDPDGYVVGTHAGEFTSEMLAPFISSMVEAAESKGNLNRASLSMMPELPMIPAAHLRYPGKVVVNGSRIAISDSGNNRVITGKLSSDGEEMTVENELGGGSSGFEDGERPSFSSPEGLVFDGDTVYVADAGNHVIRAIDLASGTVSTIAGNGRQLRTRADREARALSSPWDLALHGGAIYIAMAGVHQLWTLELSTGELRVHAGSGGEDILDGPNSDVLLAQPMGIAAGERRVFFADAESSAVRMSELMRDGETRTIAGTGLFDFGDVDGTGDSVRMQHPQGISVFTDGRLLVADSYNDALKWVDPVSRSVTSWVRGLNEPGGVTCGAKYAYVADTNSHRIVTAHYESGELAELTLR